MPEPDITPDENIDPGIPDTEPGSGLPTVRITASDVKPDDEAADTLKYNSAGWEGMFLVTTRLLGEKEIDVDDRSAELLFTLQMMTVEPWEFKTENLHVILKLNQKPPNENIRVEGKNHGEVVLWDRAEGVSLFPGASLSRTLKVQTGAFSSDNRAAGSATAGLKHFTVEIEYDLVPILGDPLSTTRTQLIFYVADD